MIQIPLYLTIAINVCYNIPWTLGQQCWYGWTVWWCTLCRRLGGPWGPTNLLHNAHQGSLHLLSDQSVAVTTYPLSSTKVENG